MAKKTSRRAGGAASIPPQRPVRSEDTFGAGPMSLPLLERLVRLMKDNGLTDLQLKDGDRRIILSRGGLGGGGFGGGQLTAPGGTYHPTATSPAATEVAPAAASGSRKSEMDAAGKAGLIEIKSPMVGTFYASPSPDAKPFVKVGDRVSPDTDVCIIEAMKVFNNIKAETTGVLDKILAESGQAVEYGQVLFLVRPA